MIMGKDPAVLFYTSDFISGTLTMTDEQRGKYIMLLCLQHQQGPLTEEDMLNICKTHDSKVFAKFEKNSDGLYFNARMKLEAEKRKSYSESRSKNRSGKKKKFKKDMLKTSETYDSHMEDENVNENIIKREDEFKERVLKIRKYSPQMLKAFIEYWTEKNKSKTKMRFELEKTWDLEKRLARWNANSFGKPKSEQKPEPERIRHRETMTQKQIIAYHKKHGKYPGK